ncbi:MAG: DUF6798 domain-containing protein [Thermoguttaceae bacterium]|nr:DUF6798 domain-containing protein [Thermoguttaceae bacterium]
MNAHSDSPAARPLLETVLVFLVFVIQGGWPVPDVNEPYYLGKAIHHWNPEWGAGDFFLESPDAHQAFFFTFGWLALLLSPLAFAWVGRLVTWWLLAWSWRRLSSAVLPKGGWAVLTAALFVCLLERCHMAGEWVIGGVEGKSFAYAFVFFGLEALVRARWNRCFILLGIASSLHVLVGGWSVLAAGVAWWASGPRRPDVRAILPGLVAGGLLALPGLLPVLVLDLGTDRATVRTAHEIYVYVRLGHHLAISLIPWHFIARFVALTMLWVVLWRYTKSRCSENLARLNWFVLATVVIAAVGALLTPLELVDRGLAAGLLRFYWYRLADFAVPMGVALAGTAAISELWQRRATAARWWLAGAVAMAAMHVGAHAVVRPVPQPARAFRVTRHSHIFERYCDDFVAWRDVCRFVAQSPEIEHGTLFLTDRLAQTFTWYSGRGEVANWKNIPQDAKGLVEWWRRMKDMHATRGAVPDEFWYRSLSEQDPERLRRLGKQYGARYAVTFSRPPLALPIVYRNRVYAVYCLE